MISAFVNGKYELLKYSCKDTMHEKYRSHLIKNYDLVYNKCISLGALSCFLSGAGPTIMAIIKSNDKKIVDNIQVFFKDEHLSWNVKELSIDNLGAMVY